MLITGYVTLNWNPKIKAHYEDLGYNYTKMKDEFRVNVKDLTDGSSVIVDVKCDYCSKIYQKPWCKYIIENRDSHIHKDCCLQCRKYKTMEYVESEYGVRNVLCLDDVRDKCKQTNMELHGYENPFSSDEIKDKIKDTNIEKYGVASPLQNKEILEKVKKTCKRKYGVDYFIQTQRFKGEDNPRWKGGISKFRNERYMYEYISWRKSVYTRDNYTCVCCNDRNGNGHTVKFNAHHLKNRKDFPEERYNPNNGVTLCEHCHMLFHSLYGKKNE